VLIRRKHAQMWQVSSACIAAARKGQRELWISAVPAVIRVLGSCLTDLESHFAPSSSTSAMPQAWSKRAAKCAPMAMRSSTFIMCGLV
jgi:hypothetical protein